MPADNDEDRESIKKISEAINQFVNGDAEAYKACWSHGSDTSIFGGRGDHEIGWDQVSARLDWAASGFKGGWTEQEVLISSFGADLGYTVSLERGEQTVAGRAEPSEIVLRVAFRRGRDGWGIVHRHADPVIWETSPDAILVSGDECGPRSLQLRSATCLGCWTSKCRRRSQAATPLQARTERRSPRPSSARFAWCSPATRPSFAAQPRDGRDTC